MDSAEEMDEKDDELRETIKKLWPIQGNAMALILVPPKEGLDILLLTSPLLLLLLLLLLSSLLLLLIMMMMMIQRTSIIRNVI